MIHRNCPLKTMTPTMNPHLIIVAAGTGSRMNSDKPKQYMPLLHRGIQKPVLAHTIDAFLPLIPLSHIHIVIHADHGDYFQTIQNLYNASLHPIIGGQTRQDSVKNALQYLYDSQSCAPDSPVLIHDAARPFISQTIIQNHLDIFKDPNIHAACTFMPAVDTICKSDDPALYGVPLSRDSLQIIQTPQSFRFQMIYDLHHQNNATITDDCILAQQSGYKVHRILGERQNYKITLNSDL